MAEDSTSKPRSRRLQSLDAYRGFIMLMLAADGFGIARFARLPSDSPVWRNLNYDFWQRLAFHFQHPDWIARFGLIGISFWDLIQPAFMFMVGVAMPYSYSRRESDGHSAAWQFTHVLWRAFALILLGVFLRSLNTGQTHWVFIDVVAQIGLGYVFVYLLMKQPLPIQLVAFVLILAGYWLFFFSYSVPEDYDYAVAGATEDSVSEGFFAPWSKNANVAYAADVWLLNLFPRPEGETSISHHRGGYVTLNFIPSIATMLLGVFCGQLLRSKFKPWQILGMLAVGGAVCMLLGVLAGESLCPIVKKIWTPSWVLFSGGWVIWMLAAFYFVFDLCRLRWLAFPLIVVGMNSIAAYIMGWTMRPWAIKNVETHFGGWLEWMIGPGALADDMYGRLVGPTAAFVVFWLILWWMYRQRFFVRV